MEHWRLGLRTLEPEVEGFVRVGVAAIIAGGWHTLLLPLPLSSSSPSHTLFVPLSVCLVRGLIHLTPLPPASLSSMRLASLLPLLAGGLADAMSAAGSCEVAAAACRLAAALGSSSPPPRLDSRPLEPGLSMMCKLWKGGLE